MYESISLEKTNCAGATAGDIIKTIHCDGFPYAQSFLCLVGFFHYAVDVFPGLMSSDSIDQFSQALGFKFSYLHPPAMSFVWAFMIDWLPRPFGMLTLYAL